METGANAAKEDHNEGNDENVAWELNLKRKRPTGKLEQNP